MAIRDLLVAYQGDEGSQNAVRFALQMGRKYHARITGAHVEPEEDYGMQARHWLPDDVLALMQKSRMDAVKGIEASFRAMIAESGTDVPHDWISIQGAPSLLLARLARYFDILLTGPFEGAIRHGGRALQPEDLLLRSGKPMIMVPSSYPIRPFKEYAVVAWDGSRSAARALTDAMQILETKKKLDVVTVETDEGARTGWLGDHDIIKHLERHGLEAQIVPLRQRTTVGRALLDYCAETEPDVLVMGAFGRRKFGSLLFGGVSRYILENQSVPVLMSH